VNTLTFYLCRSYPPLIYNIFQQESARYWLPIWRLHEARITQGG
jgi:hypothetical protein